MISEVLRADCLKDHHKPVATLLFPNKSHSYYDSDFKCDLQFFSNNDYDSSHTINTFSQVMLLKFSQWVFVHCPKLTKLPTKVQYFIDRNS